MVWPQDEGSILGPGHLYRHLSSAPLPGSYLVSFQMVYIVSRETSTRKYLLGLRSWEWVASVIVVTGTVEQEIAEAVMQAIIAFGAGVATILTYAWLVARYGPQEFGAKALGWLVLRPAVKLINWVMVPRGQVWLMEVRYRHHGQHRAFR